jgi:hypothetical protein
MLGLFTGGGTLLVNNNNWKDTQQAEIAATGFAPPNDLEPAIAQTLNPGNYTAILSGYNGVTGVGLVEIYDVDTGSASFLSNISTRGLVGTGNNVMIAGVVAGPTDTGGENVIVRALGPTLAAPPFNVPGTLGDPMLELRDGNGALLQSNDNWKLGQQA